MRDIGVPGHDRTRIADGAKVLRRVETERGGAAQAAAACGPASRSMSLSAILQDRHSGGDAVDRVHVVHQPVKMGDHDRIDCACINKCRKGVEVHQMRCLDNIDEHRDSADCG